MERLALFDLDNTLLNGDSDYEWGQFMCDQGVVDRAAYEAQNRVYYERYVRAVRHHHRDQQLRHRADRAGVRHRPSDRHRARVEGRPLYRPRGGHAVLPRRQARAPR
jgi:FMN phosphatase YigB (HAD superfamily)